MIYPLIEFKEFGSIVQRQNAVPQFESVARYSHIGIAPINYVEIFLLLYF